MPEYKFVTSGSSDGGFLPASKDVRSHAIRTALHRSSSQPESSNADQSEDTVKRKAELKGRFRLTGGLGKKSGSRPKTSRRSTSDKIVELDIDELTAATSSQLQLYQSPTPCSPQSLGTTLFDPFNSLPVPANHSVDRLIKYFLTSFNLNLQATELDKERPWFPFAMRSPLLLRATLALSAGYWTAAMPCLDPDLKLEGYKQKGDAMSIVSKLLADPGEARQLSSNVFVLASIATLANGEAFQGHFAAADLHLTGLYNIIESQGGMDKVVHDYILARCINWADVHTASGLGRIPIFPTFHTLDDVVMPDIVLAHAALPSLSHLDSVGDGDTPNCTECHTIFLLLRQTMWAQDTATLPADSIRILMYVAEKSILYYLYGPKIRFDTPGQQRFSALVLAAQLFLYAALRGVPTMSHVVRIISSRLCAVLTEGDTVARIWHGHYPTLLWISFVGVVGTVGVADSNDRMWFASLFSVAFEKIQDTHFGKLLENDDLRHMLNQFLWKEKCCQPALDEFWQLRRQGIFADVSGIGLKYAG